jgi:hypothetical protein
MDFVAPSAFLTRLRRAEKRAHSAEQAVMLLEAIAVARQFGGFRAVQRSIPASRQALRLGWGAPRPPPKPGDRPR